MLILLAIGPEERHGYAIMRQVADITGGATKLGPGAVYTTIRRLLDDGLIEETDERPDAEMDDQRRRYYRLTTLGRVHRRRRSAPTRFAGAGSPSMGTRSAMTSRAGGQERLYRSLLRAYPSEYRAAFAEQMVQLFGDQIRDEGALQTWLKTAVDLPKSAVSERMRRNRTVAQTMTVAPTPASRILGLLGVVGGTGAR